MASGKRKNAFTLDFYGASELLKKIDDAGGNLESIIGQAVVTSMEDPKNEIYSFIMRHRQTGATKNSFTESPTEWKNGQLKYRVGFDIKKGGLPALFLDVGTPKMKPYFFIHNAVQKNLTNIRDAQQKALSEVFKELL